jgi:hypothetical protein
MVTAATHYGCDGTGPEVAKAEEVFQEFGSIRFQNYTFRNMPQKRKAAHPHLPLSPTHVNSAVFAGVKRANCRKRPPVNGALNYPTPRSSALFEVKLPLSPSSRARLVY